MSEVVESGDDRTAFFVVTGLVLVTPLRRALHP